MTTLNFPTQPSPVEPDPAEVLAQLTTTSPTHLYQREKRASVKRNKPKVEAAKAQLAAIHAQLKAEEAAAKRGGRPRKGIGAGVNVVAPKRKSRAKPKPTEKRERITAVLPPGDPRHGTRRGYDAPCRCAACRESESARRRRAYAGERTVRRYTRTAA